MELDCVTAGLGQRTAMWIGVESSADPRLTQRAFSTSNRRRNFDVYSNRRRNFKFDVDISTVFLFGIEKTSKKR